MNVVLVTGSGGLIGSEAVRFYAKRGFKVAGIDNDMRAYFFGNKASTSCQQTALMQELGEAYDYHNVDIRDSVKVFNVLGYYGSDIKLVIHTAAQPSHDWAAKEPLTDFGVNALGTLNMLEATRLACPEAVFIFTSTNKVYGSLDRLPLREYETRYDVQSSQYAAACFRQSPHWNGISEHQSIDQTLHSVFGASKVAADIMAQEYGRYFGMKTGVFRGGCLTGPSHQGAQLHGFLSYLVKCVKDGTPYKVFGYKGKQVRDQIHAHDVLTAFDEFFRAPRPGEVYNLGGGRRCHASMLESIALAEEVVGKKLDYEILPEARIGDHQWYVSDMTKFHSHYPAWLPKFEMRAIIEEIAS